ncbi:hypothetical protein QBC44DRAFT_386387 [Cladorrhinum sp. PSN332]|nr:hypothetical protein QBC44DRAFT_386387 [Cladorrhinum sp. PSN332]
MLACLRRMWENLSTHGATITEKLNWHNPCRRQGNLETCSRSAEVPSHSATSMPTTRTGGTEVPQTAIQDTLASDATPTGFREDIVLLSWLVVLLRTREDDQVGYGWTYKFSLAEAVENEPENTTLLSTDEVLTLGMQTKIRDALSAVSRHVNSHASSNSAKSQPGSPVSLLLSTSSEIPVSNEPDSTDNSIVHLDVQFSDGQLAIRPAYRSNAVEQFTLTHRIEALADIVRLCISNADLSIEECFDPTSHDLDAIWGWNHVLPPTQDFCMHQMIAEEATRFPDKVAIDSWDGTLTYDQVDRYSSSLAHSLIHSYGVSLHDFVPVCFEKSRWTIVAVLAVMKAGATMVLMDPTLPLARLQNMAAQVDAKTMLSSHEQLDLATSIVPSGKVVVVGPDMFAPDGTQTPPPEPLPAVPTTALMYIIFTSGSTGTPKGVKISHQTYTSSAIPRAKAVGYCDTSRVLDFASYAFDVSIDNMLLTLGNGGCLCIPSDEDRLNDINGVIRRMKINYAGITPSMARILDLDVISSLTGGLGLGGEAVSARDAALWGQHARIIIGYGPCECTIGCTINSSAAPPAGRNYITIGPGNGAAIWIVNPDDHNKLVALGAVGELLVEGPIVGQGYLNDSEKTAAAFIHDPTWLTSGHRGDVHPGRRGRLYKTGDLGKYAPDGSGEIIFVGRKDTQVKLRGQRVELGEIESQLKARLPADINVVAEVIVSQSGGPPTLVAFISSQSASKAYARDAEIEPLELPSELRQVLSEANSNVVKVLPRYMVPTAYMPVTHMPTLISGKTDRKRLRAFGSRIKLRDLQLDQTFPPGLEITDSWPENNAANRPLTDTERLLREVWVSVLKLADPGAVRSTDNFFALGGDSLAAMRLVTACRDRGMDLSVTRTFANPTLSAMAQSITTCNAVSKSEIVKRAPYSLMSLSVKGALLEASQICRVDQGDIEDMYPCTPTQESLFTFSLKSSTPYIAQRLARIPPHFEVEAWKAAWNMVITAGSILRTRLVQLSNDPTLLQVVVKANIEWRHSSDLEQYLDDDKNDRMNLGDGLARYAIVDNGPDCRYMVWTIHHAVYDGWSEPLVLDQVRNLLLQHDRTAHETYLTHDMGDFVGFVKDTDGVEMREFWQQELHGAVGPQFPPLPSRDFVPTPDTILEHVIPLSETTGGSKFPFTPATLIRAAWALVSSRHSGNDDVVFGETLTGRDISLEGVETIVGPLIATVPVRVRIDRTSSIASYLQAVQQTILSRIPYQHTGMQNIRRVSRDAQYACEAPSGIVIQPEPDYMDIGNDLGFEIGDVVREAIHFNPYSLMLACGIHNGGSSVRVCASFDSSLIEVALMQRILAQLEMACKQLVQDLTRRLDQVPCWLPDTELDRVWGWNRDPPLVLDDVSGFLRADPATKQGTIYPRMMVPWVCDIRNPSVLAPIGCAGELWIEGACLTGDNFVDSPPWLVSGSSKVPGRRGKVQPTGDIVRLREDGTVMFVGRKEDIHHNVDIADFERLFPQWLGSSTRFAAGFGSRQELVIFIEVGDRTEDAVRLLEESYTVELLGTTLCATVPTSLVTAVRRLDKYIRNTLASHLVPSAYIVVDNLPVNNKQQVDRRMLAQVASGIPQQTLDQVRRGFEQAWKVSTMTVQDTPTLSVPEAILQAFWAKTLGINPSQIEVDDNFFRLGGDSVLAMKLVSSLRAAGHGLSVANIFRFMKLGDAAKVMKVNQFAVHDAQSVTAYVPFSLLPGGALDKDMFLSEFVRPQLVNPDCVVQDVYPVTNSQALDVRATIRAPRTSVQYTMMYLDNSDVNHERLLDACRELVKTHDILRTVFVEYQATFLQVVLKDLDIVIESTELPNIDSGLEQTVNDICLSHIHTSDTYRLGAPFFNISFISTPRKSCLILGLSHAQYDGVSLPRLLEDLGALYTGHKLSNYAQFSSYIAQTTQQDPTQAKDYWSNLLSGSSLSIIGSPNPGSEPIFKTTPVTLATVKEGITAATILTSAWAVVLARRLKTSDVTFGNITSGRASLQSTEEVIMGPCYQFTPVRVVFHPGWSAQDLLEYVQKQVAESLEHDWFGFARIKEALCGAWGEEGQEFFGSVVHAQDVIEEGLDEMEKFGDRGVRCKIGISNPHGEAGWPLKVVSFVRGGEVHVGVLGEEVEEGFVEGVVEEVRGVVGELVPERLIWLAKVNHESLSEDVKRDADVKEPFEVSRPADGEADADEEDAGDDVECVAYVACLR